MGRRSGGRASGDLCRPDRGGRAAAALALNRAGAAVVLLCLGFSRAAALSSGGVFVPAERLDGPLGQADDIVDDARVDGADSCPACRSWTSTSCRSSV